MEIETPSYRHPEGIFPYDVWRQIFIASDIKSLVRFSGACKTFLSYYRKFTSSEENLYWSQCVDVYISISEPYNQHLPSNRERIDRTTKIDKFWLEQCRRFNELSYNDLTISTHKVRTIEIEFKKESLLKGIICDYACCDFDDKEYFVKYKKRRNKCCKLGPEKVLKFNYNPGFSKGKSFCNFLLFFQTCLKHIEDKEICCFFEFVKWAYSNWANFNDSRSRPNKRILDSMIEMDAPDIWIPEEEEEEEEEEKDVVNSIHEWMISQDEIDY